MFDKAEEEMTKELASIRAHQEQLGSIPSQPENHEQEPGSRNDSAVKADGQAK